MTDLPGAAAARDESDFARAVRIGLGREGQKELPSRYFYDDVGSALFEVITLLPEYGLTRADDRILRRHAPEIVDRAGGPLAVAELGSGSGTKTRWILEALAQREPVLTIRSMSRAWRWHAAAGTGGTRLASWRSRLLSRWPARSGLRAARTGKSCCCCSSAAPSAISSGRPIRLSCARSADTLRRGDALLLGADLVKPVPQMLRAYDDPTGVTAAFNLNLLARINRELGGDFDLRQFRARGALQRRPSGASRCICDPKRRQQVTFAVPRSV